MTPRALLMCVVFICALDDPVRSQRARCAANQCVAFFQEPEDFPGAQQRCKDSGGQLYSLKWEHVGEIVTVRGSSYWVELPSTEEAGAGLQSCPAISLSPGGSIELQWAPCRGTRNAFLCQYTFKEPCSGLQAGGGAQVAYTMPESFTVDDSDEFPPGTIAVTAKVRGNYLESKHLCASRTWVPAPWSCEVMRGGCEHNCISTNTCFCPLGRVLHDNNISCTTGPCEDDPCTGEGEECEPTRDGFKCTCGDEFVEEDGECVNVTICDKCEHMQCNKLDGVYQCTCRKGFRVAAHDPTKCEFICAQKDCPARCDGNVQDSCFCPAGYITDIRDGKPFCTDIDECDMGQCHHRCENVFGGYRCLCKEGFQLHHDGNTCMPIAGEENNGSGFSPPPPPPLLPLHPSPSSALPAVVPPYVKTGSVLGIAVFMMLCAVLLYFMVRSAAKRCNSFKIPSIKHEIDIFYLQPGASETYKRLSQDIPFKRDS